MATTTSRPPVTQKTERAARLGAVRSVVADATATAGSIATDASARLPAAAGTTRAALDDANRRIRTSSDEMLRLGTAVSFGLAVGLLVAGANRMVVAAALVPVGMMGMAMLDRWGSQTTAPRRAMQDG